MFTGGITLLIIAYTLISIAIFLEVVCYKKNLESLETIGLTISLLLLIVALTISPLIGDSPENTNIFTLLAMVLVGVTTPLNVLSERQHSIKPIWKQLLIGLAIVLFLAVIVAYFFDYLNVVQYLVAFFLGASLVLSMIFVRLTKPNKNVEYREKTERIFAVAFIAFIAIPMIANYAFETERSNLIINLTTPILFILLAVTKIWEDLQRLSIFNNNIEPKEQHFKNFALTEREKEIAIVLTKGLTYKQISEELHISMPTVKTHASNIYKKCGVKSRSELTALLIN